MAGMSKVLPPDDAVATDSAALMVGDATTSNGKDRHTKKRIISMMPDRYVMVFLCALCTCINYADRVNMSVAIISMSQTYNFNLKQQSMVLSSFFLGYIPMQIGGAVLCRRFGAKTVLAQGAFLWSVFTILTPFAADISLHCLLFCRVLMGLAEGIAFPSIYHFLSEWIPSHERGRAIALFLTGAHVGTVVALIVSPYIIRILDWRYVFYIFGSVGFAWIAAWDLIAYDYDDHNAANNDLIAIHRPDRVSDQEIVVPLSMEDGSAAKEPATQSSKDDAPSAPSSLHQSSLSNSHRRLASHNEWHIIRKILSNRSTLCVCISQSVFSMVHYVILSWLPTYFKEVFGTDAGSLSFTFIPYAAMAFAANAGGYMSDSLIRSGTNITLVRKIVTVIACVGAALSLVVFSQMQTVSSSIAAASFSMAFMSMHSGGFESAYMDLASPKSTGIFKAVANTLASVAGFIAVPLSTYILYLFNGSWRSMFASLSVLHILGMVIFTSAYSAERVLTDGAL